jgi:hypothetical protein
MVFEGEFHIDDKRYEELIKLGYDTAKKNLNEFEQKYECSLDGLSPTMKKEVPLQELEEWRISLMAIKTLEGKLN